MRRRGLLVGGVAVGAAALGGATAWIGNHRSLDNAGDAGNAGDAAGSAELWAQRFDRPEGGTLELATMRGKPLIVNFWATWCAPCVKELPQFERFSTEYASQGWQVLGVAIDNLQPVREFLERVKVSFPIGLAGFKGSDLSRSLGNTQGSLPFTVVVEAGGRIVERRLGETSFEELQAWASKFATRSSK